MTQSNPTPNIWILSLIGGIIAAVLNTVIALIAPSILGQDILIPNRSTNILEPLPLFAVIAASLVPAFAAAAVLLGLQKFTKNPIGIFQITAIILTVLSLFPLATLNISLGIKIALGLMHIVAAASIVGTLTRPKAA